MKKRKISTRQQVRTIKRTLERGNRELQTAVAMLDANDRELENLNELLDELEADVAAEEERCRVTQ